MVSAEFLERLEQAGRELRGDERPFGGVQLVLSGDFFQLRCPPKSSIINSDVFFKLRRPCCVLPGNSRLPPHCCSRQWA